VMGASIKSQTCRKTMVVYEWKEQAHQWDRIRIEKSYSIDTPFALKSVDSQELAIQQF